MEEWATSTSLNLLLRSQMSATIRFAYYDPRSEGRGYVTLVWVVYLVSCKVSRWGILLRLSFSSVAFF